MAAVPSHRLPILAASLAMLALPLCGPAHANDAIRAVDALFAAARETGASRADYAEIAQTAPNDAILRGGHLAWDLAFKLGEADVDLDIRITAAEVRLFGARAEGDGYAFDRVEYPGAMDIVIAGGITETGTRTAFDIALTQYDAVTTGYFQPVITVAEDADHPVSRFFPAIRAALKTRIDSSSARLIEAKTTLPDGQTTTETYTNISMTGVADGRIAEQRVEKLVSVQPFQTGPTVAGQPPAGEIRQESGPYVVTGTDIRPMLALLSIIPLDEVPTDTLIESVLLDRLTITTPVGSGAIASLSAQEITLDTEVEPFDLGTIGDEAVLGTLPMDEASLADLGRSALDVLDGFNAGAVTMNGLAVTADGVNGTIDTIAATDASYVGVGSFEIRNVSFAVAENNASLKLGSFRLTDLMLAPLANYLDIGLATQNREPSLAEILAIVPMLGGMEIKGLDVASDELPGPVRIDSYELAMDGFIDPIPTAVTSRTQGASFPVGLVEDADAKALFERLGLTQLAYADELDIYWDPDTQVLSIAPLAFSIEGGGSVRFTAEIGGIPRLVFENPEQAQAAFATATVIGAELTVKDARLVTAFLEGEAAKTGLSAATLANALADQAATSMGPLAGTPFAKEAEGAVRAFLLAPDELVVTLAPNAPVPVAQILGLVATAPGGIPDLLGVTISANR